MTSPKPPEFSGIVRIYGRSVPENEDGGTKNRLDDEYAQAAAQWGNFVLPMMDGHGAIWTRLLTVSGSGVPSPVEPSDFGVQPFINTVTNRSGTITVGGTSQQAAAALATRRFLLIQNPSTETEPLFYDFGTPAASATSPSLAPGQAVLFDFAVPTQSVNVNAATLGHVFIVKEGIA